MISEENRYKFFLEKAIKIHGNRYEYKDEVMIIHTLYG
jgi:hypothetical protein